MSRLLVTTVHSTKEGDKVNTRYVEFLVDDPAVVECALDAAWTAFEAGRTSEAEAALGEIVPASLAGWWYLVLSTCSRPPRVS